jgi:hypothetical protein
MLRPTQPKQTLRHGRGGTAKGKRIAIGDPRGSGPIRWGPAYLAADFAFTNHWMSTDRLAVGDHLTNAQSYGGRLEGGYRYAASSQS